MRSGKSALSERTINRVLEHLTSAYRNEIVV